MKRKEKGKEEGKFEEKIIKQSVGIDIAKDDFKAGFSVLTDSLNVVVKGNKKFANTTEGFEKFSEWINHTKFGEKELHFTMEATGVYYECLAYYLHDQAQVVHVVLPNQAKKYGQSLGVKSKTDKIDAQILSQMGLERKLRIWEPLSPNFRKLRQLTRERTALVETRTRITNQKKAYQHQGKVLDQSVERADELVALLNTQVTAIEKEIQTLVNSDAELKKRLSYPLSIKGIGQLTAVTIVSETNGFAAINSTKQLTSYAGLDVRIKESGQWKGKSKISKHGNKYIRKALYYPAISKVNHHAPTKEQFERMKEKKGIPMMAYVAQQRKLLGLIYTLWNKQEMFQPNMTYNQTVNGKIQSLPLVLSEEKGETESLPLELSEEQSETQSLPLELSEKQDETQYSSVDLSEEKGEKNVGIKVPTLQDRLVQSHAPSLPLDGTKVKRKNEMNKKVKKVKKKG